MRKLDYILILCCIVCVAICAYLYYNRAPKIAYVDLPKVYNQFELKKELEKKYENTKNQRLLLLDSMKLKLKQMANVLSGQKNTKSDAFKKDLMTFNNLKQEFQLKERDFSENDQMQASEYEKQIWTRVNGYTKEFSKENSFDILLGADGSGILMNINEKYDCTESFIKYINAKYQGNEK